jgi:hypothetical protein
MADNADIFAKMYKISQKCPHCPKVWTMWTLLDNADNADIFNSKPMTRWTHGGNPIQERSKSIFERKIVIRIWSIS